MSKARTKRYIAFYKLRLFQTPHIETYGLMCTRTRIQCFKLGLKHLKLGKATFFYFSKVKPKKVLSTT